MAKKRKKLTKGLLQMLRSLRHGRWQTVSHGEGLGNALSLRNRGLVEKRRFGKEQREIYIFDVEFRITPKGLEALSLFEGKEEYRLVLSTDPEMKEAYEKSRANYA
jgi:hypothetical protein